jgi:hypothetical protein
LEKPQEGLKAFVVTLALASSVHCGPVWLYSWRAFCLSGY